MSSEKRYSFCVDKACRSYKNGGQELWTLTVRAGELPRGLSYGPNARYASLDKRPAKEMLATLENEPETFVLKNNGIMLAVHSLHVEGVDAEITCIEPGADEDLPGHGVLNGGHTYMALQHALQSDDPKFGRVPKEAVVMLTVGIGIPEDDIWKISRARNTSEKVPLHALRELAGDWSLVKRHLPPDVRPRVALKPNDPEAKDAEFDMTDLVRRLALLNNTLFPAENGVHPVQAYTSLGTLVKQYSPEAFASIAPLLPEVLKLEEKVVQHWVQMNGRKDGKMNISAASGCTAKQGMTLLTGWYSPLTIADPFVLPVMAAFRVFVKNGSWQIPLDEAWEKYGPRTVETLWTTYKEEGKSSAAVFGRAKTTWRAACDLTKSAAIQAGYIAVG